MGRRSISLPLGWLTDRQLLLTIVKSQTTMEESIMSALTDALNRLSEEVALELQQLADALSATQAALNDLEVAVGDKAAVQAALDEALAAQSQAVDAINAQADALAADNPVD